jgi:ABC-type nitrate/sulfonate/bicarbonate transport system substrate-binding protein
MAWQRPWQLWLGVLLAMVLVGGAAPRPLAAASVEPVPVAQPAVVQMATVESSGNAGFYIAQERGYFAEQGIQLELTKYSSGIDYVPALARGQVDVATTDLSAGFLNVFSRDIPIKMVADRGSLPAGAGYIAFVVRPDLAPQIRDYSDLRGRRFGISFEGAFTHRLIGRALELGGLTLADADINYLPSGDVPPALANGAIDLSIVFEPQVTIAVERGFAVRWRGADELLPGAQSVVISYGPQFADRTEIARRWMVAYLKGVREYTDAYRGGPNRAAVIQLLTQTTPIRDPALWDRSVWTAIDPNGHVNAASILDTQAWFRRHNLLQADVDLRPFIDTSFTDWAVGQLGPYQ